MMTTLKVVLWDAAPDATEVSVADDCQDSKVKASIPVRQGLATSGQHFADPFQAGSWRLGNWPHPEAPE